MGELFDKGSTVFIILLIIAVIGGFGFAAMKIMEPSPKNETNAAIANVINQSAVKNENTKNEVVANAVSDGKNNVSTEDEVEYTNSTVTENVVENETIVDENELDDNEDDVAKPIIPTNVLNVKKYEENGFMKVENVAPIINFPKTRLVYNFNNEPYNLEFVYPAEWMMGSSNIQGDITVVQCSKDMNRITSTVINEINIEDNPEISYDDALTLLENKLREYADSIGEIYEINNVVIEEIETEDGIEKVLKFEYDQGQYYKTYCYSKIEIVDSYIYVLTVAIDSSELNDEMIVEKDNILKTFKVSDAD